MIRAILLFLFAFPVFAQDVTLSLNNTGVTAGAYTCPNITILATGRISLASSGTCGGSQGPQGATGPQGVPGPVGPQGPAGSGGGGNLTIDRSITATGASLDLVSPDGTYGVTITAGNPTPYPVVRYDPASVFHRYEVLNGWTASNVYGPLDVATAREMPGVMQVNCGVRNVYCDVKMRHLIGGGPEPALSGPCGSGATIKGTDMVARITVGSGSPTSCTMLAAGPYATAPVCNANASLTSMPLNVVTAMTSGGSATVTISSAALTPTEVLHVVCGAFPAG